ncbi:MAG: hypothetical protein AB1Z98_31160, partial [Nannocystaceae bacterium]
MARRTAELVVGMALMVGPLAYALTLEPVTETELVVVHEPSLGELSARPEPVVPLAPVAPVIEPVEDAPEPPPRAVDEDLIAFAYVNEAGLVLSNEAEAAWGKGRLRRHAGPGQFRAAKRADARVVPESMWAQRGRSFDLYGPQGKVCTARLGELSVLAQHDGPTEFDLFNGDDYAYGAWEDFEANSPSAAQTRAQVWSLAEDGTQDMRASVWLAAEIIGDAPCEGALWARDSELPPPILLEASDEPSPLGQRRIAEHEASEELAQIRDDYETFLAELDEQWRGDYGTWDRLAKEHPAKVRTWSDDDGTAHFVELHFGTSEGNCGDGHYSEIHAIDAVVDGAFESVEGPADPVAIFDADLDGRFERLYESQDDDDPWSSASLESETLGDSWYLEAVFTC